MKERKIKVTFLQERFVELELLYALLFPFSIVINTEKRKDRRAQLCTNPSRGKATV